MDFFPSYQALLGACTAKEGVDVAHVEIPVPVLKYLISRALEGCEIDQAAYVSTHEDVKLAVSAGRIASGRHHFISTGFFEGRDLGQQRVDIKWYLQSYPDVRYAIEKGRVMSPAQHFHDAGHKEGRAASEKYRHQQQAWLDVLNKVAKDKAAVTAQPDRTEDEERAVPVPE